MKVCHVIHDLRRGGAEHLLVDLAGVAAGVGMEMSVVSLMPTEGHGYADALRRRGIDLRSLELRSRWDPRSAGMLASVLRDLEPDVVHAHLKHADLVAGRAAPRVGLPLVSSLHVVEDAVGLLGRFKRRMAMRSRDRSAARILAVSSALRDWYLSLSDRDPSTVLVLRNGVPAPPDYGEAHRSETRRALGVPDDAVMAATVVILRPGKGIEDLLEVASGWSGAVDLRFVIAGNGPEEGRLRTLAEDRGLLDTRVYFPGFVEDVAGLLAASDLLVHPSHADALATAVIHGMAAGLPVVATDVGGTREIVADDHGVVVPARDPGALGAAIAAVAGDPAMRTAMGARAGERFAAEFDITVWAGNLMAIYRDVVAPEG